MAEVLIADTAEAEDSLQEAINQIGEYLIKKATKDSIR